MFPINSSTERYVDRVNNWASLSNASKIMAIIVSLMYIIFDNFKYILRNNMGELLASSIFTLLWNLRDIIHISKDNS